MKEANRESANCGELKVYDAAKQGCTGFGKRWFDAQIMNEQTWMKKWGPILRRETNVAIQRSKQ